MPLCDLVCKKCGEKQEHLVKQVPQPNTDCPDTKCGKCGHEPMSRTEEPQKTSFSLVGGGWFKTGGY